MDIIFKLLLVESIIFTPPNPSTKNRMLGLLLLWIIYFAFLLATIDITDKLLLVEFIIFIPSI